jgi:hypothetical protein
MTEDTLKEAWQICHDLEQLVQRYELLLAELHGLEQEADGECVS